MSSDMNKFERNQLDNYITGHYGEDQFKPWDCPKCGAVDIPEDESICPECEYNVETDTEKEK